MLCHIHSVAKLLIQNILLTAIAVYKGQCKHPQNIKTLSPTTKTDVPWPLSQHNMLPLAWWLVAHGSYLSVTATAPANIFLY